MQMLAEVILMLDDSEACKEAKIDGRIEEMTRYFLAQICSNVS
jgi:hypothetical protein